MTVRLSWFNRTNEAVDPRKDCHSKQLLADMVSTDSQEYTRATRVSASNIATILKLYYSTEVPAMVLPIRLRG
jgi:hypothetical protein